MTASEMFLPLRWYKWPVAPASGLSGGLIMPCGLTMQELVKGLAQRGRALRYPSRRLFDPQLYLSEIDIERTKKVGANLETFPWFTNEPAPALVSNPGDGTGRRAAKSAWKEGRKKTLASRWRKELPTKESDIEACIRAALEFQASIGVERLILPAPMTRSIDTTGETEALWADIGLREADRLGRRDTAALTLALSDNMFVVPEAAATRAVNVLLDTITSRQPGGVFLVVEQANDDGYYPSRLLTVESVFRVVRGLSYAETPWIGVSWIGVLGLVSLGVGATTFVTGWRRGVRRFSYRDLEDGEGRAYGAYYSHRLLAELDVREDLWKAVDAGFLSRLEDSTPASADLINALRANRRPDAVQAWKPTLSNVKASLEHFHAAMGREAEYLERANADQRETIVAGWLAEAEVLATALAAKLGERHARTELKHQAIWREAFEKVRKE